jgi:hypothetical protein
MSLCTDQATRDLGDAHHHLAGIQLDLERLLLDRVDVHGDLYAPLAAMAGSLYTLGVSLLDIRTALSDAHLAGGPR